MKKYLLILVVMVSFFSCKKQHQEDLYYTMTGSWVETTQGKDTIVFGFFNTRPSFELKRTNINNMGYYTYTIKNDTIYTRWDLSSSSYIQPYFFKFEPQNKHFSIGNFYDHDKVWRSNLTFSKIP